MYVIQYFIHNTVKKSEFGHAFANSPSLTCKTWGLANDWEALLIPDPDHGNANSVFNAILWRKTQNKKMMCYLS